jgi:tRNA-specific 2-thiouridylase
MKKIDVRAKARELGLETAEAPESQDFIGGDYSPLFRDDPPSPGEIVDESGRIMGRHRGLPFYTIGQRRGVGIAAGDPVYVKRIDAAENRIVVGPDESLYASRLIASDVVFQGEIQGELRVSARIRQNHRPAPALMRILGPDRIEIEFDSPQRGIAPGQSVVAYDGDAVVGGGIIEASS